MIAELEKAYVLHSRPFKDTSLLVDFFTENFGRVTLVAKGARQQKKKNNFVLQPFIKTEISWQGKSQLKTLTSAEVINKPTSLESNSHIEQVSSANKLSSKYLYSAFYANELLSYLLPLDESNTSIFLLYDALLNALKSQYNLERTLRFFEFSLLVDLGYGVDFSTSASQKAIEKNKKYYYLPEKGFIEVEAGSEILYASNIAFEGYIILGIAKHAYEQEEIRQAAKIITRKAIAHLIPGKQIKSRELFI